jgi:hypothetical protein
MNFAESTKYRSAKVNHPIGLLPDRQVKCQHALVKNLDIFMNPTLGMSVLHKPTYALHTPEVR